MRWILLLPILFAALPQTAAGQGRTPQILSLGGGMSRYQLNGVTATTFVADLRFDGYFGPYFIFQPGASYMRFRTPFGDRAYLLPDLSLQLQGYLGRVRPFLGGGVGFGNVAIVSGINENQITLHGVTGVRVHLGGPWGLRLEARGRSLARWDSYTMDFTIGIMRVVPSGF